VCIPIQYSHRSAVGGKLSLNRWIILVPCTLAQEMFCTEFFLSALPFFVVVVSSCVRCRGCVLRVACACDVAALYFFLFPRSVACNNFPLTYCVLPSIVTGDKKGVTEKQIAS